MGLVLFLLLALKDLKPDSSLYNEMSVYLEHKHRLNDHFHNKTVLTKKAVLMYSDTHTSLISDYSEEPLVDKYRFDDHCVSSMSLKGT